MEPDTTFLLAGWSWQRRHFKVWLLQYDYGTKEFGARSTNMLRDPSGKKILSITGDYQPEYRERLLALLRQKNKLEFAGFDMEPFEVLRDMLRSSCFDSGFKRGRVTSDGSEKDAALRLVWFVSSVK